MTIPTYAADGRRLRSYTPSAVARLISLDQIVVECNRKGKIVCATFRPASGANPIRKTAHLGQHYSFREALPSGHHCWKHSNVLTRREAGELAGHDLEKVEGDRFIRTVFWAVPLSILQRQEKATAAKMVSIDRGRKPRVSRPVEFDSEMRAA